MHLVAQLGMRIHSPVVIPMYIHYLHTIAGEKMWTTAFQTDLLAVPVPVQEYLHISQRKSVWTPGSRWRCWRSRKKYLAISIFYIENCHRSLSLLTLFTALSLSVLILITVTRLIFTYSHKRKSGMAEKKMDLIVRTEKGERVECTFQKKATRNWGTREPKRAHLSLTCFFNSTMKDSMRSKHINSYSLINVSFVSTLRTTHSGAAET